MEINTDAYQQQQKNEQIHCEIVYCKEKVNYFTKCQKRKETRH